MKWLREHWPLLVIAAVLLVVCFSYFKACKEHDKRLTEKDKQIEVLEANVKASEENERKAKELADQWIAEAGGWQQKFYEKEKALEAKKEELGEALENAKTRPVNYVIERTREILVCTEIENRSMGVIFSEMCARKNLIKLEDGLSARGEVKVLAAQKTDCQNTVASLNLAISAKNSMIKERGIQLASKNKIIEEWKDKFKIEKRYGRSKAFKSLLIGAGAGFGLAVLIRFIAGAK